MIQCRPQVCKCKHDTLEFRPLPLLLFLHASSSRRLLLPLLRMSVSLLRRIRLPLDLDHWRACAPARFWYRVHNAWDVPSASPPRGLFWNAEDSQLEAHVIEGSEVGFVEKAGQNWESPPTATGACSSHAHFDGETVKGNDARSIVRVVDGRYMLVENA